jgi:hypothetical protein
MGSGYRPQPQGRRERQADFAHEEVNIICHPKTTPAELPVGHLGFGAMRITGQGIEGGQNPALAALFLSLKKGIVGLGFGPEKTQAYICLYGKVSTSGVPQPIPLIPESVAYLGLVQPLISTVLIFLLLLAVRNHFRIK